MIFDERVEGILEDLMASGTDVVSYVHAQLTTADDQEAGVNESVAANKQNMCW